MMTTLRARPEPRTSLAVCAVPRDPAAAPVASASLAQTIREVVRTVSDDALRPVARADAGLAYQPKTLLALVTYCYARDICASDDIEDTLRRDGPFRRACNEEFPSMRLIRRFRRENREAIRHCLAEALRFLALPLPVAERRLCASDDVWAEAAEHRIEKAMFLDAMET